MKSVSLLLRSLPIRTMSSDKNFDTPAVISVIDSFADKSEKLGKDPVKKFREEMGILSGETRRGQLSNLETQFEDKLPLLFEAAFKVIEIAVVNSAELWKSQSKNTGKGRDNDIAPAKFVLDKFVTQFGTFDEDGDPIKAAADKRYLAGAFFKIFSNWTNHEYGFNIRDDYNSEVDRQYQQIICLEETLTERNNLHYDNIEIFGRFEKRIEEKVREIEELTRELESTKNRLDDAKSENRELSGRIRQLVIERKRENTPLTNPDSESSRYILNSQQRGPEKRIRYSNLSDTSSTDLTFSSPGSTSSRGRSPPLSLHNTSQESIVEKALGAISKGAERMRSASQERRAKIQMKKKIEEEKYLREYKTKWGTFDQKRLANDMQTLMQKMDALSSASSTSTSSTRMTRF